MAKKSATVPSYAGPFKISAKAAKLSLDELGLQPDSARYKVMAFALKQKGPITREAVRKVVGGDTSQALSALVKYFGYFVSAR